MKFYLIHLLTVCQVLLETLAFSSTKTIYLPPESADELHLGCYEEQKNKSSFYQPGQNGLSLYWCIEACGYEKFPLAAVFNDTNCHCADDSVTLLIKNDSCNSSEEGKIFQMYNTSCFMVELVELYQELIFEQFPSKITPLLSSSTSSVTLSIPSSVTTLNLSDSIQDSEKFTRFTSKIKPSLFPSISSVTLSIPSSVTTLNLSDPIQYSEKFTRFSSKMTPSLSSGISSVTLSIPSSVTTLDLSDPIQYSEKFTRFSSKMTPSLFSGISSVTLFIPSSVTTLNLSHPIQYSEKSTRFSSKITPSLFSSTSSVTLSIPSSVTTLNLSDPIQYSEKSTRFSSKMTPSIFSSISSVTLSIPSSVTTLNLSDPIQYSEKFTRFSSKMTPSLFSGISSVTLFIPSSVTTLNLSHPIQYSEKSTRFSSKITPSLFSSTSSVTISIPSSVTTLNLSDPIQYSEKSTRFSSMMTPSIFSSISSVTLSIPSSVTTLNLSDNIQYSEKFTRFSSMMTPLLFSSVSSITPSTPLTVTPPDPILYSVDFGDGTTNSSLQGGFIFTHRYATTGVFNLTLTASRHNWTIFNLTRMIRVISRLQVTGMECPDAVKPWRRSECTLEGFRGSDVLALVALKGNTSQNITISDVPRITLETEEGRPVTNKTDFNGTLPGTFILPSLEFSTETSLEAWELHAENPGPIELQVYRADWNTTNCTLTRHPQPTWAPSIGPCGQVSIQYCQRPVSMSSCAHKTGNYIKVYSMDVNLTVGYNLIVVPEEERFIARAGDVAGFRRNTSGAALQRTTAEQTSGAYYSPVHNASGVDGHLESMVYLNISFRMKLRGSVRVHAKLTVSCFSAVGIYPLLVTFVSAIPTGNNTKAIAFQSTITVQTAITKILINQSKFVVVNTTRNMTANVLSGTNVTCEWNIPNASFLEQQSRHLAEDNTTEGAFCHFQFHFSHVGYFPVTLRAFNLVSNEIRILQVFVREIIRGLKVEMCYSSFAFDNAFTCYNASVETGTKVGCTLSFNPTNFIGEDIGKRIYHGLTPVGNRSFTLYCSNKVPQRKSVEAVNVTVKVVENPLSIKAPLIVATDTLVKITCQINWNGSSPTSFFAKHGLTGKRGTDMVAAPNLTLQAYSVRNTSVGYVVLYKLFKIRKLHNVWCIAKNHPDLNTVHQINAIHSITGIDVISSCNSSIEIGTRCRFEAQMSRGDSPKYGWTVAEGDTRVYNYSGQTINHQFRSVGGANITVNVLNSVSLNSKAISFVVYSAPSYASSVGTSQPLTSITPSKAFPSSVVVTPVQSFRFSSQISYTSQKSLSRYPFPATTASATQPLTSITPSKAFPSSVVVTPTQSLRFISQISSTSQRSLSRYPFPATTASASFSIPSLQNMKLYHASSGLVGQAINFSVSNVEMEHLLHFSWNWDDQSSTEEGGTVMTHRFITPGQYFVCVNVSSGIDRVVLCGHVIVQHPIKGLQIRNIAVGSEKTLILEFEILQGTNVTYSVDYGDNSVQEGFLSSLPRVIRVRHPYGEPGTYTLSISAKSMFSPNTSVPSRTFNIMNTPCVVNELRMLAVGENSSDCPEIPQEYEYSIYSWLQINCSGVEEIKYEWKVQQLLNDSTTANVSFHNQPLSSDVLFLPAKSLRGGPYKFTLMVTAMPLGILKTATGFLRVRLPKLLASIDCGSERVMSWDKAIVLNGSASHDPNKNDVSKASSSLIFEWFYYSSGNISGFKRSIDNKQPVLTFPPESLDFNKTYLFVLSVTVGSRQATAMQTIKVLAGSFPPLCVRCKENCAYKLRTSEELVLTSEGCYDNKTQDTKTCRWELHGPRPSLNGISRRSVDSEVISISYSYQFKLDPSDLIPNQTYTIFFNNLNSGFSAQYSLTTDAPPSGGSCSVSPSEGVAIKTQFRISCPGWTDEDSPLWYEYFFKHPTYGSMLLFYGWMPFTNDLFLPPGLEKHNFNLQLLVKITDVLGSYAVFPLQAKVRSFNSDAGSVSSNLRKIVSGPHSKLEKLLAVREFRQATQLMSTVVTMLNRESIHATDSLGTENRVEVRSRVIQGLSSISSSSPHGIRQALGGLLPAISVSKELSPDSMVDGANALTNMAKALATTFKSERADNIIKNILTGLNFVLDAAVATSSDIKREQGSTEIRDWIDDSNEARNKDHQEKCERATNKSLEGINYCAQKLLDYQRKGDPPLHVKSGLMRLTVTSQTPSNISAAALDGGKVTFQLPTEVTKNELDRLDAVNTKVVTMSQSPFVANDVIPVTSPVSTLELWDVSGKEIKIRNLTEPVSIFLSLNESENGNADNIRGIVRSNENMTFFKITLDKEFFLYLQIQCFGMMDAGEEMIVMGKKNVTPSNINFDVLWTIRSCNSTVEKLLSSSYLNTSGEFYLGVKLSDAGNVTNGTEMTSKIEFNISVRSVGCYYWDEFMQAWTTNGCKVGPSTTLKRIQCQCNHLTWFGSRLFVPPNELHLDIIAVKIKDPSNYALVLAVLCGTCGLYVIALVWARRQDRKDVQKIGTTVSPSNRPEDTHAYEVIISTGMRRHAGTSANVSMLMTGERGESHAFLLKNSQCMTLARSSVSSFLVTTSETLGELSYIRVWHDNFGGDPSWYVKQISIREISSDRVWHFLCEHWLAVDEGDGLIDRIFPVASDEEIKEFRRMFVTKAYKDLTDSHLWFSVVCRPPQSPFTRVQRVSCCFSLLLCTMMANAMWYEADKGRYTAVKVGTLEFSWEQVSIGICSSLIVFPINLILVQIFRHCNQRPPQKNCRQQREHKSSTATEISMVKLESGQSSIHGHHCPAGVYRKLNIVSPSESIESLSGKQKFNQTSAMRSIHFHCPAGVYRKLNIVSPSESIESLSGKQEFNQTSAMRSIHFQPLFVSLGASTMNDSTNDVTSLLLRENHSANSPVEAPNRSNTMQDKQFSNGRRLPWWFVYVGWALVTITSLTAASVTLLYGIEFGLTKSAQWLLSMFFSVTQDIFVSQPLKVVALAIFFAYIFKKPNIVMFSTSSFHTSDDQWLQEKLEEEHTVVPPAKVPSEDTLRRARDRAAKERAMHVILLDLGTYLVFTLLVLLIAYGFRDQDAFHQNDAVAKVVLNQSYIEKPDELKRRTFSQLSRQRDVWNWTENILLPTLYNLPSYHYTGKAPKFIEGESGLVVGVARFRQHRVKKDSCSVISQVRDMFSRCADDYHMTSEDDQAYTAGWKSLINTTELLKQTSSPDPWRYSTSSDLNGYPYSMGIETYSGGGYVIELSHIYYKAVRQMKEAKSRLWLDHYTRSVFAEFTLFNPNSNLFSAATFLMETLPTGGVFPSAEVLSYRLYRYVGDFQLFILACELFFFVFVLYFTYRETKKIYKTRRFYFAEVWNLMDLTVLILCWIAIAYYFICLGLRKWTLNLYHENSTKFISFQYISAWQLMFEGVVGVTVFATCLKFIKLFRFNRRIFLLSCTLRRAGGELLQYSIVFLVVFIAFAQLYHFLFSTDLDSFNTLLSSMQQLLSVLLGKFNIDEMMSAHKLLGVMIFLLYMVIMNFLLLNILIVIIIDSFNVVKQQNDQMKNDFELLEYIMARFKDAFGIRTLNKKAAPLFASPNNGFRPALTSNSSRKTHVENLEVFDKMEDALDRLICYVDTIQGIDNDDDMLCCYISRRIHSAPAIKIETVPVDVQSRRARSCNCNL